MRIWWFARRPNVEWWSRSRRERWRAVSGAVSPCIFRHRCWETLAPTPGFPVKAGKRMARDAPCACNQSGGRWSNPPAPVFSPSPRRVTDVPRRAPVSATAGSGATANPIESSFVMFDDVDPFRCDGVAGDLTRGSVRNQNSPRQSSRVTFGVLTRGVRRQGVYNPLCVAGIGRQTQFRLIPESVRHGAAQKPIRKGSRAP
jgi:hypothetical protein